VTAGFRVVVAGAGRAGGRGRPGPHLWACRGLRWG